MDEQEFIKTCKSFKERGCTNEDLLKMVINMYRNNKINAFDLSKLVNWLSKNFIDNNFSAIAWELFKQGDASPDEMILVAKGMNLEINEDVLEKMYEAYPYILKNKSKK